MTGARERTAGLPVVLFGAFDRHNFGDLLFPHIVAALLPGRELSFAGLADRDLRRYGGHAVTALPKLAAALDGRPAAILHVGGEILTCEAAQAAVMLLEPDEARHTISYLDARPAHKRAWARRMLGTASLAPYVAPRALFPAGSRILHDAVGGVALDRCAPAMRAEVFASLADADLVGVRDARTLALLEAAGIGARLMPDAAVMVAQLFGDRIRARAQLGEVGQLRAAFPAGYLAVQFSAGFGDDATLARLAVQLDRVSASTGLGIVLFRAGAAPWHDDLDGLRRLAARLTTAPVKVFESLQLWDICALLEGSRGYCGSSLHGRILAMAFALPRIGLRDPSSEDGPDKHAAFASTWEDLQAPGAVAVDALAEGMRAALAVDRHRLELTSRRLVEAFREGFAAIAAASGAAPPR